MRISVNTIRNERGAALVAAAFALVILLGFSVAILTASLSEQRSARTRKDLLNTLYIADSGISRSIAEINSGTDVDSDGLGTVAGTFADGTYSVVAVDNGDDTYTLTSNGDHAASARAIEVTLQVENSSLFTRALFGDESVKVTGTYNCDSYDSRLGTYDSQDVNIDPVTGITYASDNGDVGSNGDISFGGTATVIGDITPGPDSSLSGGGYCTGSTAPASDYVELPPVIYSPTIPSSGDFATTSASPDMTVTAGTYHYGKFTVKNQITFQGDVVMYLDGDFSMGAGAGITLDAGATLTIYHDGDSFSIAGQGIINRDESAASFQVYSTGTSVYMGGGSESFGCIYAPNAKITLAGDSDKYGSCVGKTIQAVGTGEFHYDEALGDLDNGPPVTYVVAWREVAPS